MEASVIDIDQIERFEEVEMETVYDLTVEGNHNYYLATQGEPILVHNSGKSDVIDMITVALSIRHGWKFGIFSPENKPYALHFHKLAQKVAGKPRKDFNQSDILELKTFINSHYIWFDLEDPTMDDIISKCKELVKRKGINGFVIDPWNFIEHPYKGKSETDYTSEALSKLTKFVQAYDVHLWLIAHPTKARQNPNKLTLYDIAGSAHFFNKCFNGLTISRDRETNATVIGIEKVKFWFIGKSGGYCEWFWDYEKGTRFFDMPTPIGQQKSYDELSNEIYDGYDDEAGF